MKIILSVCILPLALAAPSVGTLAPAGKMALPRAYHTATLLQDGKVLFTGGKCEGGCETSIEVYDPATGMSSEAGKMLYARSQHTAVMLSDGRVLLIGSAEFAEIFDPRSGLSEAFPAFIRSGIKGSAFRLADGRVAVGCGGGHIDIVDVSNGIVERVVGPPNGCLGAVMLPNGRIFTSNRFLSYTIYDSVSKSWDYVPSRNGGYYDEYEEFTVSAIPNGRVAIAGGIGSRYIYRDALDLFDFFRPQAGMDSVNELRQTRYGHAACLSPDGLLLSGGKSGFTITQPGSATFRASTLSSMEIRQPDNGRLAGILQMNSPREGHTCTLLNDGSVLLAGGEGGAALERYIPTNRWPELRIGGAVLIHDEAIELYVAGLLESSPYPPEVSINGKTAEILYFGPGQINVRIPASHLADGPLALQFSYLGRYSNAYSLVRP